MTSTNEKHASVFMSIIINCLERLLSMGFQSDEYVFESGPTIKSLKRWRNWLLKRLHFCQITEVTFRFTHFTSLTWKVASNA